MNLDSRWKILRRLGLRTRGLLEGIGVGEYRTAVRGQGLEFRDLRPYAWGDDIRLVDWNVTARMGAPYVKEMAEEREVTLVMLLDATPSMRFGTRERTKSELALEIAAILSLLAHQHGDRVGAIAFGDSPPVFVPPGRGMKHLLALLERLERPPSGRSTLEGAVVSLGRVLKRRSLVFLLSDFLLPLPETALKILAKRHDVSAFVITDPAEWEIPDAGTFMLRDLETGELLWADTASKRVREAYREARKRFYDRLLDFCSDLGVDVALFRTGHPVFFPILDFFRRRAWLLERRFRA